MSETVEILLADDSDVGRYVIATTLRRAGFEVREVADGYDALREASERPPDLAILDVKMPGLDGMEACRRLKADPATSAIPVLLLSATFLETTDQVEGLDIGADAYLTQPVEAPVLIASINSLLRARAAERLERRIATEWRVTFDAIGDAVALVDPQRMVRRCNRAFAALAQVPQDRANGRPIDEMLPALGGIVMARRPSAQTLEIEERLLRVQVDELPDPESAGHVVVTLRDVTAEVELSRERERVFRREQLISSTLQEALVPRRLPTIPGLRLSAKYALGEADVAVGGDWFEAMPSEQGVWLAIGDIAGHGVAAAAQAVQLRNNLRLLVEEGYEPAEAMSRLGELLAGGELIETASVMIAVIEPSQGVASLVNAGHLPAILIGADGRARLVDQARGPLLGFPGGRHQATPVPVASGDTLVLYTDGLVERRGEAIDDGIERLRRALETAWGGDGGELVERVFAQLVPAAPMDDTAILAAQRSAAQHPTSAADSTVTSVDPIVSEWPL